tara:strand:+ start:309 stop:704 length:396 start_codon:yes stop_codon:yes gene_type:complete
MIRNIIGVITGLIIGMITNLVVVIINLALHPMPKGVTFADKQGVAQYIQSLPLLALILILIAHLSQSFIGAFIAAKISLSYQLPCALIVGICSLILGIINIVDMQLPNWMFVEMPLYLIAAWTAGKLALRR